MGRHVLQPDFLLQLGLDPSCSKWEAQEKQKNRKIEEGKKKFGNEEINQEVREKTAEAFLKHTQTHTLLLAGSMLNVHMAPLCDENRLGFVDLR